MSEIGSRRDLKETTSEPIALAGFDVPSADNAFPSRTGVTMISPDLHVIDFASEITGGNPKSLSEQFSEMENQPIDSGRDDAPAAGHIEN